MQAELIELIDTALSPADNPPGAQAAVEAVAEPALRVPARLLEYGWKKFVALPVHTALEIVEHPKLVEVPGAPYYALGMMAWQGRWLPVLDLCALLNAYRKPGTPPMRHAVVVAYQSAPREALQYAAIAAVAANISLCTCTACSAFRTRS